MSFKTYASLWIIFLFASHALAQTIRFDDEHWTFDGGQYIIENFEGHPSLYLQNGQAYLKDVAFTNGIIEFDMYLSERTSFSGILFRIADPNNYEQIYFRPHRSGKPDAFQYTPIIGGRSAWQLYHDQHGPALDGLMNWNARPGAMGFNTVYHYDYDRWVHVKLVINGDQAEMYLDHASEPIVHIRDLKLDQPSGGIGFKARRAPMHFANLIVTPMDKAELKSVATAPPIEANTVRQWSISSPFPEGLLTGTEGIPDSLRRALSWQMLRSEPSGLANLSRVTPRSRENNTVFARITLSSDAQRVLPIDIGYSDRVRVYANDQILYSGNNGFRSRDFRHLGTIGFFDRIYIPLKKGHNDILLAVSENFGGWGVQAKFDLPDGVKQIR